MGIIERNRKKKHTYPPQTLTIEGYGTNGEGISHLEDGMACFVAGAMKGEECIVTLDKVGKSAAWGHIDKILTPSPARRDPGCPYYDNCGGCALRHMTYEEELAFKRQKVQDCIRRIGGCDTPVSAIYGAENTDRYRNKVQFPIGGTSIGFYAARTHQVTDVADCLLQPKAASRLRRVLKNFMSTYGVPAYDERTGHGLLRHLYVRTSRRGDSLCCLLVNGDRLPHEAELVEALRSAEPQLKGIVLGINKKRSNVILGDSYRTLWGDDFLMDVMCNLSFRLSVPSFYQVNTPQAEVLYGIALEFAQLTGEETVLDLYCGIGTITLCLARQAAHAIGAEVVPEAIEDAKKNARRNHIENVEFLCGDAGDIAPRFAQEGQHPDVITVDPPRKGLAPEVVEAIAQMAPKRVVYVSCDPATLARDIARFTPLGYQVERAVAVDLFPRTHHVESVALLSKLKDAKHHIDVNLNLDEMDLTSAESKATYGEIQDYVKEHTGLQVSHLYIAQVKRKRGLEVGQNYNKPKSEDSRQPQCPPEKEKAIVEALKHFGMI